MEFTSLLGLVKAAEGGILMLRSYLEAFHLHVSDT